MNLFFDWNPIHDQEYSSGASNPLYDNAQDEQTLFARLVQDCKKLQVIFLRASNVNDKDMQQICQILKPDPHNPNHHANKTLKVIDVSYNPLSSSSIKCIGDMMEMNRTIEYLGLAKSKLEDQDIRPLFTNIGRQPFPGD